MIETVSLGDRSYPVYINEFAPFPELVKSRFSELTRYVIVTNTTLAELYEPIIECGRRNFRPVLLPFPMAKSLKLWRPDSRFSPFCSKNANPNSHPVKSQLLKLQFI